MWRRRGVILIRSLNREKSVEKNSGNKTVNPLLLIVEKNSKGRLFQKNRFPVKYR